MFELILIILIASTIYSIGMMCIESCFVMQIGDIFITPTTMKEAYGGYK